MPCRCGRWADNTNGGVGEFVCDTCHLRNLQGKYQQAMAIVRGLAARDPEISEGRGYCWFCEGWLSGPERDVAQHADTCEWRRAVEMSG